MRKNCLLISLEGLILTQREMAWLAHPFVAGVVLFARNYENRQQLRALTQAIRAVRTDLWIAVDQEGGRVQRFITEFTRLPPMAHWGARYTENPMAAKIELADTIKIMCTELRDVGVMVTLMPVLDIDHGLSEIIGARSLHRDPDTLITLAEIIINALHAEGFPAVGKHFPGHGGVRADSHVALPIYDRSFEALWNHDLKPFIALAQQLDWIMPAHVIYPAIDTEPAGFSKIWLQDILREKLQFTGKIITDDLSMAAAASRGTYTERANKALAAGCDLLTVCNVPAAFQELLDRV